MALIIKCDSCGRRMLVFTIEKKCPECYGLFCSEKCFNNHICPGYPVRSFLDSEPNDEYDGNELIHNIFLKELLTEDLNVLLKSKSDIDKLQLKCRYCFQNKPTIWLDKDFGPMCASCYKSIRAGLLAEISPHTKMDQPIDSGFRIMELPENINTTGHLALLMAKRCLEKRQYIDAVFEIGGERINKIIELYDLKVLFIDEITIVHIRNKILELTPKIYIFVKQQPSASP